MVDAASVRQPGRIIVDTNVYIEQAAGRLPSTVLTLISRSLIVHCTVCLGELGTGVGNADPAHPTWPALRDHYQTLFTRVPASRILTPDPDIWIEAGLIAGVLARTQGFQPNQRKECLNDSLIYLTAAKARLPVLTKDRDDFDLIQQVAGRGAFIWY